MFRVRVHAMRRRRAEALITYLTLTSLALDPGCTKEHAEPPPAPVAAATTRDAAPQPAQATAPTSPPRGLETSALQAFLERWLDAQNRGDYPAYAALYARKFLGVKRAGERTTRFERAGWLEDRARMFKKPMQVAALTPDFRVRGSSAEVEFTQRFASGNFADEGPKRLLLVREAGALKIAHEELLASRESARGGPRLDPNFDFQFVLQLERGAFVMLAPSDAAGRGPVRLEQEIDQDPQVWTTSRALAPDALPPALRALAGQRMRLDSGCSGTLGAFTLISRVDPHFSTEQAWNGTDPDQPGPALDLAQQAEAAFELGSKWVAAKLEGCSAGSYAQRADSPAPVLAEAVDDAALVQRARAAFAKLRDVREHQAAFKREVAGSTGTWWDDSLAIDIYRHPRSGQTLIAARAAWTGESCADFAAETWAFFELRGKALAPLRVLSLAAELHSVLDINGDGRLELVVGPSGFGTDRELVSPDVDGPAARLEFSYQDCPC